MQQNAYAPSMANVHVVAFQGEIDISRRAALKEELGQRDAFGATAIIIDLSKVSYVDASFLSALCLLQKRLALRDTKARVALIIPTGSNIMRIFRVTGLDRMFAFYESTAMARAGAKAGSAQVELGHTNVRFASKDIA
jgi:anti-anti-sigma factor